MLPLTLPGPGKADVSAVWVPDLEACGAIGFVDQAPSIAVCASAQDAGVRAAVATQPLHRPMMRMMKSTAPSLFKPSVVVAQVVVRRIRERRE